MLTIWFQVLDYNFLGDTADVSWLSLWVPEMAQSSKRYKHSKAEGTMNAKEIEFDSQLAGNKSYALGKSFNLTKSLHPYLQYKGVAQPVSHPDSIFRDPWVTL